MTVKLNLPNLVEYQGRLYVRVKRAGRAHKIRIKETPGTPEFLAAYSKALETLKATPAGETAPRLKKRTHGSLGWLAAAYFSSPEFRDLDTTSQRVRRQVIENCLHEPLKPGSKLLMGDCPYRRVDARHILMIRDRRADAPGAANNRLKYLGAMFGWAIGRGVYDIGSNPCRDVRKFGYTSDGFYTWKIEDVERYIERHPIGTVAHLALSLMLFLGARRGDAIKLGPKNMRGAEMVYVPRKTARTHTEPSVKPILAPLAEAIARTPIGLKTFLVTARGEPFSDAGIGNKMREWCDQAGLPECTAHGLKKVAAMICAEAGATDRMLMALFDWKTEKMANIYTAKANRTRLAADAARLLGAFWRAKAEP